jgi:FAD:protein FMN transferase
MKTVAVALDAMATRFEIVLHGESPVALRAAGEEALAEVARLEAQLSLYRPNSEIAHLNAGAAQGPVRVTPALLALLQHAKRLSEESAGAFDVTVAPLVRCWGFMRGSGRIPTSDELAEAHINVGMDLVRLNAQDSTVRFARAGVMLDLGAIGKGYAVERAAEVLREAGITSAIIHGGTSTVYALGHPPDAESWNIAVEKPKSFANSTSSLLAAVPLKDEAMSVSAVWGKSFEANGKTFGHVLDPRTGWPVSGALLAAVVLPSATETDALSTALLTAGSAGHAQIAGLRPGLRTLLVLESGSGAQLSVEAKGVTVQSAG